MEITEARNQVRIDITPVNENLVSSIKETMETIVTVRCISRVREGIRGENEKAYIPDKISIGPLHYGDESLKAMEDHKWKYLYTLLNRKPNLEASLDACVKALKGLEYKARLCYDEEINLSSDDFVKMMLVDGGFIIELFLKHAMRGLKRRNDPLFSTPGFLFDLRCNMILLENQIPFFILQKLYQIVPIPEQCTLSFTNLAFHFFRNMIPGDPKIHREKFSLEGYHLLDLIRHCFLPTIPRVKPKEDHAVKGLESAKQLKADGVLLKKSKTENLLDIKFVDGVLEIPPVGVHRYTESLLRNLIAFEKCACDNTQHISSYVVLMSNLIRTEKDAKFLKRRQILLITSSDDATTDNKDVSGLFARLSNLVGPDLKDFCFDGLCEQVGMYKTTGWRRVLSKNRKKKKKKGKRLNNFRSTGTGMLVVAIFLVVIIFVGTLFSILSFFLHHR